MQKNLEVNSVSFSFSAEDRKAKILSDFSFSFSKGITIILGPSGCGKTTLLNMVAGLLEPITGSICYPTTNKRVGYVFQAPSLLPWKTIWQNILSGAELTSKIDTETKNKAINFLKYYGLSGYEHEYPRALSGGMQQRVALIRAVLAKSEILLLDEPFSSSDYQMRRSLQFDLSDIVNEEKIITLMVTHDINEAVRLGDEIIILGLRPSTIKHVISIDIPREERLNDMHELKLVQLEHEIRQFLNMEIKASRRA